ncbi:hypothetical protein MKZ38_008139 [Zalerion maritima]|uniref:3-keto-steroid reductase n=1 Tax=Zalerion maritima TaxID=339359 RepID=A0AAD5WPB4_9PEZI|nr:hypothetical protein MKZ38_008139 [Zalerion maritima]
MTAGAPPPWAEAKQHEQHFSLITGANSGVGLAIGQRLVDDFLNTRSPSSHLVVVVTTRSVAKSRATLLALRKHLEATVSSPKISTRLSGCLDAPYRPVSALRRVHLLSIQLDLCDLENIYGLADTLVNGVISNPPEIPATKYSYPPYSAVRLSRIDSVILNAGIGGWTSLDWFGMVRMLCRSGLTETTTFPDYKISAVGKTTRGLKTRPTGADPASGKTVLGEVFMANVFGHYVFAHEILPLLTRMDGSDDVTPRHARIIWQSSIEAMGYHLDPSDLQGLKAREPYESTKRLTDVLALTSNLPSVQRRCQSYFAPPPRADGSRVRPVKMYVAHPGIVVTTIFPLHWFLMFWYRFIMYVVRWVGSPWHTVVGYAAAVASVWLALESDSILDETRADRSKWGSACDRMGIDCCKRTEVMGWGWEGKVQDSTNETDREKRRILRRDLGRWSGSKDVTKEKLQEFKVLGADCWSEMESLRLEWDARVKGA